jgi:hypothetical protein
MQRLRKCATPVNRPGPGGLKNIQPCGKPATVQRGKQWVCAGHDPEKVSSWVIRERATGEVVMETFDRKKIEALNAEKYEAIPIGDYLAALNKKPMVSADG